MKKILSVSLALALSATMLVGCGGSGTETEGTESDTIKVGINYELSGAVATYGQSSVDGILLAIEQVNAAGGIDGKQIEVVQADNKSEPAESTSIATKLISQDKVVTILGPATTGNFKATIPVCEKNAIPCISGSATADDVTIDANGLKEYAFRICFNDSFQGVSMAKFAMNNLSAAKAVIIMDNSSDYGKGLAKNFEDTFIADGGTIVATKAYVAKDKDFNSILTSIKDLDFDVIFLPGYYQEAGLIIKQARALGIDAPVLGADGFDSPVLLELAGAEALNDVYFSNHYSSLDKDPVVLQFIADFKAKYNREPDAFNALGYDVGKFFVDAVERAGSADPEAIKEALAGTTNFVGVTGSFSIDENHNPVKSIVVIGLENGVQATSVKVQP